MTLYFGVDVSRYQSSLDWTAARGDGIRFMFARASLGLIPDARYAGHIAGAEAAGVIGGAYHYLWPGVDPVKAVDLFLDRVGKTDGRLLALDVEHRGEWSEARTLEAVDAWVRAYRARTAHPLIIYTGKWYWSGRMGDPVGVRYGPLWDSHYVATSDNAPYRELYAKVPPWWWDPGYGAWPQATFLQFTSRGLVKGYGSRLDVDAYRGSIANLRDLARDLPDTDTGDKMRDFIVLEEDGAVISGAVSIKSPDGVTTPHYYLRLTDGALVGPANGLVGKWKPAIKVRLTEDITSGSYPGVDRRTGWLVGSQAAFLLDTDVTYRADPSVPYSVVVTIGGKPVTGTVTLP